MNVFKRLLKKSEFYVFLSIIAIALILQLMTGQFFMGNNLIDTANALIVPGLFAIAAFLIIVTGGIDVSFPVLASLSIYITVDLFLKYNYKGPVFVPLFFCLAIGFILGLFNGFLVNLFKVPVLIITLATQGIFKGILQGGLNAVQIPRVPDSMRAFGKATLIRSINPDTNLSANLPSAIILFFVVIIIISFILRYTMFGRGLYAIGGDETAAKRAGFRVWIIRLLVYAISGSIAALAAFIRAFMVAQVYPTILFGMEMEIIAAVVLGGALLSGGTGSLLGSILGILMLVIIETNLLLFGIPLFWQRFFIGVIIVVGVAITEMKNYKRPNLKALKKQWGHRNG